MTAFKGVGATLETAALFCRFGPRATFDVQTTDKISQRVFDDLPQTKRQKLGRMKLAFGKQRLTWRDFTVVPLAKALCKPLNSGKRALRRGGLREQPGLLIAALRLFFHCCPCSISRLFAG